MSAHVNTALFSCPRPEWLALVEEEVLDPDRLIVDPHHHLWGPLPYNYPLEAYEADLACGHNIVASVYVECKSRYRSDGPEALRPLGEVEYAAHAAGGGAWRGLCAGIVGFADLHVLGTQAASVLPLFIEAGLGRLRGIRNVTAWTADPQVAPNMPGRFEHQLLDARFREGFASLAPMGLVFDAFVYHPQLDEVKNLAEAFPDTIIVLDHLGGPLGRGHDGQDRDAAFAQWRASMRRLAHCGNVRVKLGGLGMRFVGLGHDQRARPPSSDELVEAWRPYMETAIDDFGPRRCMFESNFPPDKGSFAYRVMWNAFKKLARGCSEAEQARLFSGTAAEVYRIVLPSPHASS